MAYANSVFFTTKGLNRALHEHLGALRLHRCVSNACLRCPIHKSDIATGVLNLIHGGDYSSFVPSLFHQLILFKAENEYKRKRESMVYSCWRAQRAPSISVGVAGHNNQCIFKIEFYTASIVAVFGEYDIGVDMHVKRGWVYPSNRAVKMYVPRTVCLKVDFLFKKLHLSTMFPACLPLGWKRGETSCHRLHVLCWGKYFFPALFFPLACSPLF